MAEHDVIIIGGGTGGLRAAVISAKSGYDTGLVEPNDLGGTCLNRGCIPTKTLLHAAEVYHTVKEADQVGIKAGKAKIDFSKVMGRMRDIINTGRTHAEESVDKIDDITLYKEKAKFKDENTVVAGKEEVTADKIIIATGASPWAPPIPGLKDTGYLTNVEALQLEKLPKRMVMVGGGYISCEFASFFQSMGCQVTILERLPRILSMLDDDVSNFMRERLEDLGVEIYTEVNTKEILGANGKKVTVKTTPIDEEGPEQEHEGEYLLVSTGRRPNTKGLGLDNAGVELDDRGNVKVDDALRTNKEHIYAIGDVNGKAPFAHTAKREARVVLENALLDGDSTIVHENIPWAVFTFPTIGGVGMSEKQAIEEGFDVGVMKGYFKKTGKAKIIRQPEGFVKVIYDKKTRNLLGCVITGPDAHNLIHEFALLLNTPSPKIDYLKKTIHVHPTLAEVMEELKES